MCKGKRSYLDIDTRKNLRLQLAACRVRLGSPRVPSSEGRGVVALSRKLDS